MWAFKFILFYVAFRPVKAIKILFEHSYELTHYETKIGKYI